MFSSPSVGLALRVLGFLSLRLYGRRKFGPMIPSKGL